MMYVLFRLIERIEMDAIQFLEVQKNLELMHPNITFTMCFTFIEHVNFNLFLCNIVMFIVGHHYKFWVFERPRVQ